jgi:hypothetical protein
LNSAFILAFFRRAAAAARASYGQDVVEGKLGSCGRARCAGTLPTRCSAAAIGYLERNGWADGWDSVEQPEAWNFGHAVLQSDTISVEAKLFAASTLKGKVRVPWRGWMMRSTRGIRDC